MPQTDLRAILAQGQTYLRDARDPEAAETIFDEGIRLAPGHPGPWRGKAQCRRAVGDPDVALEMAVAALARRPGSRDLGRVLLAAAHAADCHAVRAVAAKRQHAAFPEELETQHFRTRGGPEGLDASAIGPGQIKDFDAVLTLIAKRRPHRYSQLYHSLLVRSPSCILEIGVFDGENARRMIEAALALRTDPSARPVYCGFDLFQDMTPEIHAKEFSKFPLSDTEIREKLSSLAIDLELVRGDTAKTLPRFADGMRAKGNTVDFIFLDGGHHIDTIEADWIECAKLVGSGSVVFFDDYYIDPPSELAQVGCNTLIDRLCRDPRYHVDILPVVDRFEKEFGLLQVAMVRLRLRG